MEKRREQSKSKPYYAPRLAVALCLCYYTTNLFSDLSQRFSNLSQLFSYFKKKGTCTFLVQNKKSTKRNLQAFRLTEVQIFVCGDIGSPHGLCANTLCSLDPPRQRYGATSEPRRWAETSDFICDGALAPFGKRFFH